MAGVSVRIKTKRQPGGKTPSIIKSIRANGDAAAYDFARYTVMRAKERVHVITGRLRDSIYYVKVGPGHYRIVVGMHYGVYEEYGTRYRPPHPFFRPAVEDAKAIFNDRTRRIFDPKAQVTHR